MFDLDGTITRADTLLPYVYGFLRRRPAGLLRLPQAGRAAARYCLGQADRGELKGAFIHATLGGSPRRQLDAWTEQFVSGLLQRGLHADARTAITRHQSAGDVLVLLSASTDLYVPAIAHALGFHEVHCTAVRWDGECLVGTLASANQRGVEKVRCLQGLRSRYPGLPVTAYGNAASDLPHLRLAEHGLLINGSGHARRLARAAGVRCVTWQ